MRSILRARRPEGQEFRASSGRGMGALGVAGAAGVLVLVLLDGVEGLGPRVGAAAVLVGVVAWVAMLRPRLRLTDSHLVLHNMLEDVHLPLAAVEEMVVRQVLVLRAGDQRYVSPVLGRSARAVSRADRSGGLGSAAGARRAALGPTEAALPPGERFSYVDFVEERIRGRIDDARTRSGVRRGSPEQQALADAVRREPAWLPIGALVVAALLVAASFVV